MLEGEKIPKDWRTAQFYNYWSAPFHYGIRTDRYTYLKVKDYPDELFDRKKDPLQLHNVAGKSKYKKKIVKLKAELLDKIIEIGVNPEELPGIGKNQCNQNLGVIKRRKSIN